LEKLEKLGNDIDIQYDFKKRGKSSKNKTWKVGMNDIHSLKVIFSF